jgi:hypothetical protein
VLREGGEIYGYSHENESSWSLSGAELCFHRLDGDVSSRLTYCDKSGAWTGNWENHRWPLYLVPLISALPGSSAGPAFFVNSIPKAGTYFASAALEELGFRSQGLHLIGHDFVGDHRGLPPAEMFVPPDLVRLQCPAHLVAATCRSSHLVGHVEFQDKIDKMRALDMCVLSLARDLRAVTVSLYRYKLNKIAPTDVMDAYWRRLGEDKRFIAFLYQFHDRDLRLIRAMAHMVLLDNEAIVLRYEDMLRGCIPNEVAERLDSYSSGLSEAFALALQNTRDRETPTFSGKASNWRDFWNHEIEDYFVSSGLAELNQKLGYREAF